MSHALTSDLVNGMIGNFEQTVDMNSPAAHDHRNPDDVRNPNVTQIVLIVFHGSKVPLYLQSRTISDISIGKDEILAKILYSSICGSDLHTIDGKRIEPTPSILGHEGVAEAVTSRRDDVKSGERFTFSVVDCCSECDFCLRGLNQKCKQLFKYGHASLGNGTGFNGCYASHIVIRAGTYVVRIPDSMDPRIVTPVNCAMATAMNAVGAIKGLAAAANPQSVLVQGAGLLGIYCCAILSSGGYTVYCTDINQQRLDLVSEFGAIPVTVSCSTAQIADGSIDVVIEVCGAKATVPEAIRVLRSGGVYILVGMIHPDSALNLTAEVIMRKCLTIRGIHNYTAMHLQKAMDFLCQTVDEFPYPKLIDPKVYLLENISQAFEATKTLNFHRVLIQHTATRE